MAGIVVFSLLVVGTLFWRFGTENGRAIGASSARTLERKRAARVAGPQRISQVGVVGTGGLACPKCGGTQFKPARRLGTKVAFGAASMLGQAKHVRCVTCGTEYARG